MIPSVPEVYNMAVNYTCGAPLMSNMSTLWFIDGALSSIRDEVLQVDRERAGFYTCVHFTNGVRYANNRNVVPQREYAHKDIDTKIVISFYCRNSRIIFLYELRI